MVLDMCNKCKNNLVLFDWIVIHMFYSFRLSEWEQNISEKMQPLVIACGLPFAFILLDLTFLGVERTNIPSHGRRNCTPPASNLSSSDGKKRKF